MVAQVRGATFYDVDDSGMLAEDPDLTDKALDELVDMLEYPNSIAYLCALEEDPDEVRARLDALQAEAMGWDR